MKDQKELLKKCLVNVYSSHCFSREATAVL